MSRIFLSHSSKNNATAIALRDWLVSAGWDDLFLDLDPDRGIAAGERWEQALHKAARDCEAVLFLISRDWLASRWCLNELTLARRLNKRLFGVLIEEGLSVSDLPKDVTSTWQLVNLATGSDHQQFPVKLPITGEQEHVTFSLEGLGRLKTGLQRAGLHASYFAWPPKTDPDRAPYRGLRPLEGDDAGIFFGREAPVIEAIDRLRGVVDAAPPRMLVVLGASGAGKSSFMRAGLLPRLERDGQTFLPLPVIRPERAVINGETGLLAALTAAFAEKTSLKLARADIRAAIEGGADTLKPLLERLQLAAAPPAIDGLEAAKPPTLVLAVDQGEELFLAEGAEEAVQFIGLLRDLMASDRPPVIAIFTIRSDNYERLQSAPELDGIYQQTLSLPPMPRGSYAEVVKGPIQRLEGTGRAVKLDDALVDALLSDIDAGVAKDALPLLAFTLERLYGEYGATGHLTLEHYTKLGRVKGSIEAAVERAFKAADADSRIPRERDARLALLRRGLIPWIANIDPDTKAPRRRVARPGEIPEDARPLIDLLVEQRLLARDVDEETDEVTLEPAHEALLRQWGQLKAWLSEDTGLLTVMDGIKRAAAEWNDKGRAATWLAHTGERLRAAERLLERPDLAANLQDVDRAYIAAAQKRERTIIRQRWGSYAALAVLLGLIGAAWVTRDRWEGPLDLVRYAAWNSVAEDITRPGTVFKDCTACPVMVAVPAGRFTMGSENGDDDEKPVREVTISKSFAVGKFEVTFNEWRACVDGGGCNSNETPSDDNWGQDNRPVINVSWMDAQEYVTWLSGKTGQTYRLLTEAEWEYAARAGTTGDFSFEGGEEKLGEYAWYSANSDRKTHPVGGKRPNAFGLYDMHGNVLEWVSDWYGDYQSVPQTDPQGPESGQDRVFRGGCWYDGARALRSALRLYLEPGYRSSFLGFRLARTYD